MSNSYLDKSDDTYKSGELLRSNGKHNSSIHCYYYSCIQLCNHYFQKKESLTDSQIRDLFKDKESHKKTINHLVSQIGLSSRKALTVDLSTLKENRTKADYRQFSLGQNESEESKELCDNIIIFLKSKL